MANTHKGEVGVTVGGKAYILRPTFDALCELEEVSGKPIDQVLLGVQQGRFSGVRAVVFSLLQDKHGDEIRTLKQASEWIEALGGVDDAMDLITKAFAVNTETAPEGGEIRPQDAQAGTGVDSVSPPLVSA